jgi:hypothetical protein
MVWGSLPKDRSEQHEYRGNTWHDFRRSHLSSPALVIHSFRLHFVCCLLPAESAAPQCSFFHKHKEHRHQDQHVNG